MGFKVPHLASASINAEAGCVLPSPEGGGRNSASIGRRHQRATVDSATSGRFRARYGRVAQTPASETPASLRTHSRNAAFIGSSAVASGPAR